MTSSHRHAMSSTNHITASERKGNLWALYLFSGRALWRISKPFSFFWQVPILVLGWCGPWRTVENSRFTRKSTTRQSTRQSTWQWFEHDKVTSGRQHTNRLIALQLPAAKCSRFGSPFRSPIRFLFWAHPPSKSIRHCFLIHFHHRLTSKFFFL